MDRADTLEDNMTKLYSLLWGQCTEALQQGLHGHEYFEENDTRFDAKWLLKQIKMKTQGIKKEKNSNTYDSIYKLIRQFFSFCQAKDKSCNKFPKRFLDRISSLNISGIGVTTHSHMTDMECKKLTKADPSKNVTLAKNEAASSSS